MARNMKMELHTFSLILYQSKNCGHRIHILFMMYDVYWYCQMKKKRMIMKILKKEWFIWKFWKKGGGGNEIHAPCTCDGRYNGNDRLLNSDQWCITSCWNLKILIGWNFKYLLRKLMEFLLDRIILHIILCVFYWSEIRWTLILIIVLHFEGQNVRNKIFLQYITVEPVWSDTWVFQHPVRLPTRISGPKIFL